MGEWDDLEQLVITSSSEKKEDVVDVNVGSQWDPDPDLDVKDPFDVDASGRNDDDVQEKVVPGAYWPQSTSEIVSVETPAIFNDRSLFTGNGPQSVHVPDTPISVSSVRSAVPASARVPDTPISVSSVRSAVPTSACVPDTPISVVEQRRHNTVRVVHTPASRIFQAKVARTPASRARERPAIVSFASNEALMDTLARELGSRKQADLYVQELAQRKYELVRAAQATLSKVPLDTDFETALMASHLNKREAVRLLRRQAMRHSQICAVTPLARTPSRGAATFLSSMLPIFEVYEKYRRRAHKTQRAADTSVSVTGVRDGTPALFFRLYQKYADPDTGAFNTARALNYLLS